MCLLMYRGPCTVVGYVAELEKSPLLESGPFHCPPKSYPLSQVSGVEGLPIALESMLLNDESSFVVEGNTRVDKPAFLILTVLPDLIDAKVP